MTWLVKEKARVLVFVIFSVFFSSVDAKTKQFLTDSLDPVFGFTSLVRFSWSTADIILREKAVPVHWYIL